jgi:hypothetical protein
MRVGDTISPPSSGAGAVAIAGVCVARKVFECRDDGMAQPPEPVSSQQLLEGYGLRDSYGTESRAPRSVAKLADVNDAWPDNEGGGYGGRGGEQDGNGGGDGASPRDESRDTNAEHPRSEIGPAVGASSNTIDDMLRDGIPVTANDLRMQDLWESANRARERAPVGDPDDTIPEAVAFELIDGEITRLVD